MLKTGVEIADRFNPTRRLGGTDEAPVWEAIDRRSNLSVVIKVQRSVASGAGLEAEYHARRRLVHPGIAAPLELVRSGELELLLTNLAASGDLGSLRGQSYRAFLPQLQLLAQALGYLHTSGLVHGDLKPANVLLDAKGSAQLTDFANLKPIGSERGAREPFSPYSASPQQRQRDRAQPSDDIYSFGALIWELLCGQPPGYALPAADAQSPPPPSAVPQPVQPVPQRLLDLTMRCLQGSPERRPASMQEIAGELSAIAAIDAPARAGAPLLTPPRTAADVLRPSWQRSASQAPVDPKQLKRQGFRYGVAVAVTSILALIAVALFVVPTRKAAAPPPTVAHPSAAVAPVISAPPLSAADLQALAQQKSAVDEQRASVSARLAALTSHGSESWAAAATAAAVAALASADALIQQRQYPSAQAHLSALARDLAALEMQREPAFKSSLQRGESALQQGDAKAAAASFAQALAIKPNDATAQSGARRATTLDAVFAQVATAKGLEQQGRISEAAAAYHRALTLDPLDTQAQAGVARTGAQIQADQFGRAMARAYGAIGNHQEEAARAAIDEARRLKPNDPEIARATAQLAAIDSSTQLAAALAQAHAAEASEHWQDAVTQYQHALALDSTLVDARHSMAIAADRARLDRELSQIIAHPERTYTEAVYAAARVTLQQAQAIAAPGPVLASQVSQVAGVLDQAATPISVTLRSDNVTTVTVYRVGQLGSFGERVLQLKPGRYVVIGTRNGFRDVRQELNVAPGTAQSALLIQCVDPI
jgi:eukaryotic-like serine/threonine-protein kinase